MNGEAVVGTQEIVEVNPGDASAARDRALSSFPGLGPPDLVTIRKHWKGAVVGRGGAEASSYHFVRGLDVSSAASIAAYLIGLRLEQAPWYSNGGWDIVQVQYRTYSAISTTDITVTATFPGGVSVSIARPPANAPPQLPDADIAADRVGDEPPAASADPPDSLPSDDLWNEVYLSAMAREVVAAGELPPYPCLKVLRCLRSQDEEDRLLDAADALLPRWHLSGSVHHGYEQSPTPMTSRIGDALLQYFVREARFQQAEDFFLRRVVNSDVECGHLGAALAWESASDWNRSMAIVDALLRKVPDSSHGWLLAARLHKHCDRHDEAKKAAEKAISAKADNAEAWIVLADIYVDMKKHDLAFLSLNRTEMRPPQLDPFLRELIPGRRRLTTPQPVIKDSSNVVGTLARRLKEERSGPPGSCDQVLAELPSRLMTDTEKSVYSVLAKALYVLGWDELLAVRGSCFVMEADIVNAPGASPTVEELVDNNGDGANEMGERSASTKVVEVDGVETELTTTKKLCKPWLDFLVTNMYEDLRALAVWQAEDQITRGDDRTISGSVAEPAPEDAIPKTPVRSSGGIAAQTNRPAVDWLRRGELARRLGRAYESSLAFLVAIKVAERNQDTCISAWIVLLEEYATEGNVLRVMVSSDAVWRYMDRMSDTEPEVSGTAENRTASGAVSGSTTLSPVSAIRSAITRVISRWGVQLVREEVSKIKADLNKPRLCALIDEVVERKVHGYDR